MSAHSNISKLPARCYLINKKDGTFCTEAPVVCIVAGESGFYPIECRADDAAGLVERGNARYSAEPHHIEAMQMGSCFGWHVPAADADYWRNLAGGKA